MLEVNDIIVHLQYGTGLVTGMRTIKHDGKNREYYCIEIAGGAGTLLIPEDQVDEAELRHALNDTLLIKSEMERPPEELTDNHQLRRTNIEKKIRNNNPKLVIQALRDLVWRQRTGKLTTTDKRLKDSALEQLISELVLSTPMTVDTAQAQVDQIIDNAMQQHLAAANT